MTIIKYDLAEIWITSSLNPEQINNKKVWILDKAGNTRQGIIQIEEVSDQKELLVIIEFNSGSQNTVSLARFRMNQEQIDFWTADNDCVLKVP